jgi:hypothetical protein
MLLQGVGLSPRDIFTGAFQLTDHAPIHQAICLPSYRDSRCISWHGAGDTTVESRQEDELYRLLTESFFCDFTQFIQENYGVVP